MNDFSEKSEIDIKGGPEVKLCNRVQAKVMFFVIRMNTLARLLE